MIRTHALCLLFACIAASAFADAPETLPGTRLLTEGGDRSKAMLDGLHRFAEQKIETSLERRAKLWSRDASSREAYERSVQRNRDSFRQKIGVVDARLPATLERFG